jgi:nitrate reductase molybdenum cofactor assembly chaperone NarJ/NarW
MSVIAPTVTREGLTALAPLFSWPDESYLSHIEAARTCVALSDRQAARSLDDFARGMAGLAASEREMAYTSTFDLAPSCSPYLGIHMFGEDSRDRARLMIGLRMSFAAAGHDCGGELPDHLAVVLSFANQFEEEEWADLVRLILVPALERMDDLLAKTSNPFRHLISATGLMSRAALEEGGWA